MILLTTWTLMDSICRNRWNILAFSQWETWTTMTGLGDEPMQVQKSFSQTKTQATSKRIQLKILSISTDRQIYIL